MIELEPHAEGVVLRVKAHPGARRATLTGEHAGQLKAAVTAAPEKGKANQALCELLSRELKLRRSQIELLGGAASTAKRFLIRDLTVDELRDRIQQALGQSPP